MRLRAAVFPRALVLILAAYCGWGALPAHADGNVGCLFSSTLCIDKVEWCYDDYAFGKCLKIYGNVGDEELARHELNTEELRGFEHELQRLLLLGYRWSHAYTQCVLQAMLYATKNGMRYESTICDHLADQDLTAALGAFEAGDEVDPQSVAFVKFTPNSDIDTGDFADEVYFPPNDKDYLDNVPVLNDPEMPIELPESPADYDSWQEPIKRSYRKNYKRSKDISRFNPREHFQVFSRIYNTPGDFREGHETRDLNIDDLETLFNNNEEFSRNLEGPELPENIPIDPGYLHNLPLTSDDLLYLLKPKNEEEAKMLVPQYNEDVRIPAINNIKVGENDPINKWLESQDLEQLRAALAELKEPYNRNMDPYYVSTSEFLTKNRLRPDRFNHQYNTPDRFRQGFETRDALLGQKVELHNDIPEQRIYADEEDQEHFREEGGSGEHDGNTEMQQNLEYFSNNEINRNDYPRFDGHVRAYDGEATSDSDNQAALLARLLNIWRSSGRRGSPVYTEGGLVYLGEKTPTSRPQSNVNSQLLGPELGALLADYEWGFRRRERLDVKKPGPPFDIHNTHFRHDVEQNQTNTVDDESEDGPLVVKKELHEDADKIADVGKTHDNYDVDSSYAYVGFKDSIRTWKEGANVVKTIAELLHLEPTALNYPRVDRNEVTFRVDKNSKSLNASEVASRIDGIKEDLKKELGLEVTSAGVGDKAKYPAVLRLEAASNTWSDWGDWDNWSGTGTIWAALIAGTVAAVIAATTLFLLARHHRRRRDKLRDLGGGDTEASQDYQDLCRARMSGKWQTSGSGAEKAGGDGKQETTSQRITSLSRESDGNSPSTRSSTSSWSEEPALTNMDISTGHMVLTYMEDHLKNKDRLEQEWQALCAYEAEPCATSAAEQKENLAKNRCPGVLPYDHARLVLSDVTNMTNSDYINASTITDHDPRNPAYIAAQGPLAETAADWWQMVWEQGSVVLVMLTRLTEGGTTLCHRYWPEEGSQLYHIYEVHLVSEHIWCDDYLVRSFYLKNLKTGETRTVTQFHFLSWPDRGVPASTKALLEFRRKVNKSYRGRSCPIVVHCSDGAGRTGTYCLIDMVLNRMAKGAKEIDIAATLEHIRDQRPHMVTTKQQFEFVLMAVAEEVHAILKALPAQLQQQHEKREKELAAEKERQEKEK